MSPVCLFACLLASDVPGPVWGRRHLCDKISPLRSTSDAGHHAMSRKTRVSASSTGNTGSSEVNVKSRLLPLNHHLDAKFEDVLLKRAQKIQV